VARVEPFYPERRLAIEYDGATHRESISADNRRQNRSINAGYRVLRFTAREFGSAAAAVQSALRS